MKLPKIEEYIERNEIDLYKLDLDEYLAELADNYEGDKADAMEDARIVGYDNGYDDGYNDGYDDGYNKGYNKGYDEEYEVGKSEAE